MVSVSFSEVNCQSYVSFSRCGACGSRLINNVVCKALFFEGALFFLSAVAFFDVLCDAMMDFMLGILEYHRVT